jgi:putative Ca2+/H+ antiporter (TMEM165/GDT1 family)
MSQNSTEIDPYAGFKDGLTQSYVLILLSEIGDKTFFMITALSAKFNKVMLFIFSVIAMNIMNAVSVGIGAIFPLFLPKIVISFIVIFLFLGFGLKLLYNVVFYEEDTDEAQELEENLERIESVQ